MKTTSFAMALCAALLGARLAAAAPTPKQSCDSARVTAWKVYRSCVDVVLAKNGKGIVFDEFKAFWKCRHSYFKKWAAFQNKASLAGSTCVGSRYTDNADQTVTDNLTGLIWEKKDQMGGVHDRLNTYTWSANALSSQADGSAFATFLTGASGLNVTSFAGSKDWRIPTVAQLQTILLDFACKGPGGGATCMCTGPCVDAALDPTNTLASLYWCSTIDSTAPGGAWFVYFASGHVGPQGVLSLVSARAVRGGF